MRSTSSAGYRLAFVGLFAIVLAACGGGGSGGGGSPGTSPGTGGGTTTGGGTGGTSGSTGGGGTSTPPVTKNLSATALQVVTPNPRIAYPLSVSVSLSANEATDNVSVSLFVIQKNDDPNAEVRQLNLGSQTITRAEVGARSYTIDTNIPSSVEFPGPYYIGAIVDPVEEIAESNEDDNKIAVETMLAPEGGPNILLKEVALDRTVLEIDTSAYAQQVPGTAGNVHNSDAGGTITVGADGLAVDETIDLEGFATLRLARTDTGTSHDMPLYLWNSTANRYMNAYGVTPTGTVLPAAEWLPLGEFAPQLIETAGSEEALDDLNRDSVHLNFYFPGKLGEELENAMRYPTPSGGLTTQGLPTAPPPDLTSQAITGLRNFLRALPSNGIQGDPTAAQAVMRFSICVEIRPADRTIVDRTLDDNRICTPLSILLPPLPSTPPAPSPTPGFVPRFSKPSDPFVAEDGFATKSGSTLGFGVDFGASASASSRGYIEELHGAIPITIFGSQFEFTKVVFRAQLVPDYVGKPATDKSGYALELWFTGDLLQTVNTSAFGGYAASISYSKAVDKEQMFFVGPVPVVVGVGVGGEIGIEYEYVFTAAAPDYTFGNSIGPYANLEASAHAGVGTPLFSAGVEGVLTLVEDKFTVFGGAEIELVRNGTPNGAVEFVITRGVKISNEISAGDGALNLYAKYTVPGLKDCNWGPIKGKCPGGVSYKVTKTLWSFKSPLRREDVLYEDNDIELDVVLLPNRRAEYRVP